MKTIFFSLLAIIFFSWNTHSQSNPLNKGFITDTVQVKRDTIYYKQKDTVPYLLHFPKSYNPNEELPLVVYLHSGDAKLKTLTNLEEFGLPLAYRQRNKDKFIALSPLLIHLNDTWVNKADAVLELIRLTRNNYKIDAKRIYITGHSLGSNGSLYVASVSKQLFAGVVVLGAGYFGNSTAPEFSSPPVWLIHAENDENVPTEIFDKTLRELKNVNKKVKNTVIQKYNHSMLLDLYKQDMIYDWLLSQHK